MAGLVTIPWYATVFRGDKLEEALKEIAPVALRYGASSYYVHRNRDDRYKFTHGIQFADHSDWERFWGGPEMTRFRVAAQSLYQVPVLYTWNDISIEGRLDDVAPVQSGRAPAGAFGDTV